MIRVVSRTDGSLTAPGNYSPINYGSFKCLYWVCQNCGPLAQDVRGKAVDPLEIISGNKISL